MQHPASMGHSKSSPEIEVHNITGLHQEAGKISNKLSNGIPKRTRKKEKTNKLSTK